MRPLLVLTDGWSAYPNSIRRAFREKVKLTKGVGRACLQVWPELHIGTVIKRTEKKRVVEITRQIAHGLLEHAEKLLHSSHGGRVLNTAFIERLNGTFRERLASLTRKSRHAARCLKALETGMYLIGCSYNFCFPHHELSKPSHLGSACPPAMAVEHLRTLAVSDRPASLGSTKETRAAKEATGVRASSRQATQSSPTQGGFMFDHRIVGFYRFICRRVTGKYSSVAINALYAPSSLLAADDMACATRTSSSTFNTGSTVTVGIGPVA